MTDFIALVRRHRALGYSLNASVRLARWCLDDSKPLYPENEQ
jgi:hypothetical protein